MIGKKMDKVWPSQMAREQPWEKDTPPSVGHLRRQEGRVLKIWGG